MSEIIAGIEAGIGSVEHRSIDPIPVRITNGPERTESVSANLASFQYFPLQGTEVGGASFQILPQDKRRSKAVIQVSPVSGGSNTAYVILGSREQVMNARGFILPCCNQLTYESEAAVYLAADGTDAVIVSVLDQRYV